MVPRQSAAQAQEAMCGLLCLAPGTACMKPEAEQRTVRRDEAGQGKVGCSGTPPWEGSSLPIVPIEGSRAPSSLYQCLFEVRQAEPHHTQLEHQRTSGDCGGLWERLG